MKIVKKIITFTLIFSLLFTIMPGGERVDAASRKYVTSLKLSKTSISLKAGQSKQITYKVKVKNSASKKITVKVTNPKIITASVSGSKIILKGKKKGTAKITVTTKGKNKKGKIIKQNISVSVSEKQVKPVDETTDGSKEDSTESEDANDGWNEGWDSWNPDTAVPDDFTDDNSGNGAVESDTDNPTINTDNSTTNTDNPIINDSNSMQNNSNLAGTASNGAIPDGTYKINTKVKSGMVLDLAGSVVKDETNIQIYKDNESTAQQFDITQVTSGWYKIAYAGSNKVLDVEAGQAKAGVNVRLYTYNGSDAQLWQFLEADNGYYYIKNKLGYYLDVDGGKTADSTNVQVHDKNDTNAQKWKPVQIVYPSGISIDSSSVTLKSIGMTKKLAVTFTPSNTTQKKITWSSSNSKAVSVSDGTIKAAGSGTATITAKTSNGKSASVTVTVDDGTAQIAEGIYTINTKVSANLMLDIAGNGLENGTNVQIHKNNNSMSQKFTIESAGNGWYTISHAYPKMCLDIEGASNKSGANVQLYKNNGSDAQLWRFYPAENGYYRIMNKLGNYLDVAGGEAKSDTNVSAYAPNDTDAQKWKLAKTTAEYVDIASGLYYLNSQVGSKCMLDIDGDKKEDGTNIQIYEKNDSIAQKFYIQLTDDGWYKITNPASGKCLDVEGGSSKSGANVQLYSYNGSDAQKWRFYWSNDGTYFYIRNKLGCYLDVNGASSKNATNVSVYEKNDTKAQRWQLLETSAILLDSSEYVLEGIGSTRQLYVSYEPLSVFLANGTITWLTSNSSVVTVSNGVIKAVGAGTATVTATAFNGQKAKATVTVKNNSSSVIEKAISWGIATANDNSHGYSQSNRWGPDYDCSSFVITAFKSAGVNTGTATTTRNMRDQFTQHGFQWIPWSQIGSEANLRRGDILLNEITHTEIYLGNGQNVGAHSNRGYPQTGDQTGTEVSVSGFYIHPWDGVLRYVGSN